MLLRIIRLRALLGIGHEKFGTHETKVVHYIDHLTVQATKIAAMHLQQILSIFDAVERASLLTGSRITYTNAVNIHRYVWLIDGCVIGRVYRAMSVRLWDTTMPSRET